MTMVADYIRRFTRRVHRPVLCSACRRPRASGRRLISGPSIYICESCIGEAAAGVISVRQQALCSFCEHPDLPVVASWPALSICAKCVSLAQDILAEGNADRLQ
jgi:hypothetical protein